MLRSREKGSYFVSNAGLAILPETPQKKIEVLPSLPAEIMNILKSTSHKTEKTIMVPEDLMNKLEDAQTENEIKLVIRAIASHYELTSPYDKYNLYVRALSLLDNYGIPTVKEYKKKVQEIVNQIG